MNSNEKRWIILLVAVVIIAIVLIVALNLNSGEENNVSNTQDQGQVQTNEEQYTTELVDGTKINTSEEFNKEKTYKDLTISNIQFTEKDGISVLLADVTNNGSTVHELEVVTITVLGENDEVITELHPVIERIEPGQTAQINSSTNVDVTNAKDFRIEAGE